MKLRLMTILITLTLTTQLQALPIESVVEISRAVGVKSEVGVALNLELQEPTYSELLDGLVTVFNTEGTTDELKYLNHDYTTSRSSREFLLEESINIYKNWEGSRPRWVVDRSRLGNSPLRVTSQYSYRSGGQMHRALDFGVREFVGENGEQGELNLYPVRDARVVKIEHNPKSATGLSVWYEFEMDNSVYRVVYMHMNKVYVSVGDIVTMDTPLGVVGNTGDSTALHIHMQAERDSLRINPLRLWGYEPTATFGDRLNWFYDNNLAIECSGECTEFLNYSGDDIEFSIVPCRTHRRGIYN